MKFFSLIAAIVLLPLPVLAQAMSPEAPAAQTDTATNELTKKAESGDAEATRQLYSQYALSGDTQQAKKWAALYEQQLTTQADAGDVKSMMLLATGYMNGRDYMPQDPAKAVSWFVRAAEAGQPAAAYILGEIFTQHNNKAEANRFYKQAYDAYSTTTAKLSAPPNHGTTTGSLLARLHEAHGHRHRKSAGTRHCPAATSR